MIKLDHRIRISLSSNRNDDIIQIKKILQDHLGTFNSFDALDQSFDKDGLSLISITVIETYCGKEYTQLIIPKILSLLKELNVGKEKICFEVDNEQMYRIN